MNTLFVLVSMLSSINSPPVMYIGESFQLVEDQFADATFYADNNCCIVTDSIINAVKPGYCTIYSQWFDGSSYHRNKKPMMIVNQFIILKSDDLTTTLTYPDQINPRWVNYVDYMLEHKIKISCGVIGSRFDLGETSIEKSIQWLHSGYLELFNHGWSHQSGTGEIPTVKSNDEYDLLFDDVDEKDTAWYEFLGPSYQIQLNHLNWCNQIVYEKLGYEVTTFGAPFNKADSITARALEASGMKVWLFPKSTSLLFNENRGGGEIETPTGTPNYVEFLNGYDEKWRCMVLQLHPGTSTFFDKWYEFEKILAFLQGQDITFILPREYMELKLHGILPYNPQEDTDSDGILDIMEGNQDSDEDTIPNFMDNNLDICHSGDTNLNYKFELTELMRIIQFFNTSDSQYHCKNGTEDGYICGVGDNSCKHHDIDSNANWKVDLCELLRAIQLFNSNGYIYNQSSEEGDFFSTF